MPFYSSNNAAKQWILEQLSRRFDDTQVSILDLACGSGWVWESYLMSHQYTRVVGVDFDKRAINEGKKHYQSHPRIELRVGDAQRPLESSVYDAVIALSAIEHVVDHAKFLETVHRALKQGGVAYLNYDAGHFRSKKWKERLMVPISQWLAKAGYEGSYMKQVNDKEFCALAVRAGFRVLTVRKHNLAPLKGLLRGAPPEAVDAWYTLEERLGDVMTPESLDKVMYSTTVVLEKV